MQAILIWRRITVIIGFRRNRLGVYRRYTWASGTGIWTWHGRDHIAVNTVFAKMKIVPISRHRPFDDNATTIDIVFFDKSYHLQMHVIGQY